MKNPRNTPELIIDTEGQVTFTKTDKGGVRINLFQQDSLTDELSQGETRDLIKWLVSNLV